MKNWVSRHSKALKITGVVILVLAVAGGIFYGGFQYGISWQKKSTEQSRNPYSSLTEKQREALQNRVVSIGTITKISTSSIEVKQTGGKTTTFVISKDTTLTDTKGKKIKVDTLKVGNKVIVTGTKSGDTVNATRIRLQATSTTTKK